MTIYEALFKLRQDAIARGMIDLAIVYGWSALRIGNEQIQLATECNRLMVNMLPKEPPLGR